MVRLSEQDVRACISYVYKKRSKQKTSKNKHVTCPIYRYASWRWSWGFQGHSLQQFKCQAWPFCLESPALSRASNHIYATRYPASVPWSLMDGVLRKKKRAFYEFYETCWNLDLSKQKTLKFSKTAGAKPSQVWYHQYRNKTNFQTRATIESKSPGMWSSKFRIP